jgi:hypothetical protein
VKRRSTILPGLLALGLQVVGAGIGYLLAIVAFASSGSVQEPTGIARPALTTVLFLMSGAAGPIALVGLYRLHRTKGAILSSFVTLILYLPVLFVASTALWAFGVVLGWI